MTNEMTDPFKRRQAMINFLAGKGTREDYEALCGGQEQYGPSETFPKEEFGSQRWNGEYRREQRSYAARTNAVWINGAGIKIDEAYRVVSEDDKTITVQRVQTGSELENLKGLMFEDIRRILAKSKERKK